MQKMGRKKLTIKTLPSSSQRNAKFNTRIGGLTKKAQELTVLCDVPHLLLAFSTSGKPTVSLGKR
jgi:SRF-type transcription factor (DNA-binding and dimerisation domain)